MIISVHRNLKFCHGGIVLISIDYSSTGGQMKIFPKKKREHLELAVPFPNYYFFPACQFQ